MLKRGKIGKLGIFASLMMAIVLVFSLAACGDTGENGDALTLDKTTATVNVESTTTITVTSSTTESIVWTVDKPEIATVTGSGTGNKLGLVTGVAEGTAVVTATAGDKSATCTVTVSNGADASAETVTIKLDGEEVVSDVLTMHVDDELTFTATASKNGTISWESSDDAVATVANGKVTAISAGDVTITAKVSDSVKATVKITVIAPTDIPFNSNAITGWSYWSGDSDASVSDIHYYEDTNDVYVKYSASYGTAYGLQVRYSDKYTGVLHDVSLTVVSPVDATILVNGQSVELEVGENEVSVSGYTTHTFYAQFGTAEGWEALITGEDLVFEFKNIVITSEAKELSAPSYTYDEENFVLSITDENTEGVLNYELGFFESETASEPKVKVVVYDQGNINFSVVAAGDYFVRIRAVGENANYISSVWSDSYTEMTVENTTTPINANSTDGWYYDLTGNSGVRNAYEDQSGAVIIESLTQGANPYAFQLKLNLDKTITSITMTVRADNNGYLAFGNPDGSAKEQAITGGQDCTFTVSGLNISGTLVICFGNNVSWWGDKTQTPLWLSGDIIISNIQFTYAN